ncbi:MAG: TIGR00266 family protein [Erysipelotrichaceae bacterium]|nr:TIGR00266 family protein [Erysipelotrichaceae bacterium]
MKYEIFGDKLPGVIIELQAGEGIVTQSGGMAWMTDGINMETNMKGGFFKSLGRALSGNSLFLVTYTAQRDGEQLTLTSAFPGDLKAIEIDSTHEYIGQKGAFLGATEGVEVETVITKKLSAGLFGGEGFILQKFSGEGMVFAELDGSIREIELQPGEKVVVDSGHVALFESSVAFDVQTVKGFKNILFGGEGLFLTTLTGPGKVWLQTITAGDIATRLIPFLPSPSSPSVSVSNSD